MSVEKRTEFEGATFAAQQTTQKLKRLAIELSHDDVMYLTHMNSEDYEPMKKAATQLIEELNSYLDRIEQARKQNFFGPGRG